VRPTVLTGVARPERVSAGQRCARPKVEEIPRRQDDRATSPTSYPLSGGGRGGRSGVEPCLRRSGPVRGTYPLLDARRLASGHLGRSYADPRSGARGLSVGVFELAAAGFLAGSTLGTGCHGGLGAVLCPGAVLVRCGRVGGFGSRARGAGCAPDRGRYRAARGTRRSRRRSPLRARPSRGHRQRPSRGGGSPGGSRLVAGPPSSRRPAALPGQRRGVDGARSVRHPRRHVGRRGPALGPRPCSPSVATRTPRCPTPASKATKVCVTSGATKPWSSARHRPRSQSVDARVEHFPTCSFSGPIRVV